MLLVALAMRLIVPAGYMPVAASGGWTMTICTGHGAVTVPGKADTTKAEPPCGFASLAVVGTGGEPPTLPALAAAWVASPLPVAVTIAAATPARLRPPLRAPPLAFA